MKLKNDHRSTAISNLSSWKEEALRSLRNSIRFGKHCFQNFFHPHETAKPVLSNSSSLKSVYEKLCFRDGQKHGFSNRRRSPNLRGLTVEIKKHFQISVMD